MKAWLLTDAVNGRFLLNDGAVFTSAEPRLIKRLIQDFERLRVAAGVNATLAMSDDRTMAVVDKCLVMLSKTMLNRVCEDRDMFAFVCSHELAHLCGAMDEYAADRLAIEFMAKAGFDTAGAIRLLEILPWSQSDTHPSSPERIKRLAESRVPTSQG